MATPNGKEIIPTPWWVLVARIFQIILSFVVVCAAGVLVHGVYENEVGFAIVSALFTWIIALYGILSEKVTACRPGYNTWAILALDLLMIIFWLASMGANAALRSTFTVPVDATCTNDGSVVNGGHCTIHKRNVVVTSLGFAMFDVIIVFSAFIMILFAVSFGYVCHFFRIAHFAGPRDTEKGGNGSFSFYPNAGTEMNTGMPPQQAAQQQAQPLLHEQSGYPAPSGAPQEQPKWASPDQVYPQHTGSTFTQHPGATYTPSSASATPAPYDPYASSYNNQNTGYAGAAQAAPPAPAAHNELYGGGTASPAHTQAELYGQSSTPGAHQVYQPPPQ